MDKSGNVSILYYCIGNIGNVVINMDNSCNMGS